MSRALPPVGWQSIIEHDPQSTVVCACEKTVVMLKQPGHLTSMKNEFGDCTKRLSLCFRFSSLAEGWRRSRTMVSGGGVLLGTCVGFQESVFCSQAARSLERSRGSTARSEAFCAFAVASARRGARPRGPRAPAAALFRAAEELSPKAGARRLDDGASRACASSPSG